MTERALYFGRHKNLLGILNMPEVPVGGLPAVILLNAGLLHRVGPNRMSVNLARRIAEHGFVSLRFDMSGIGDSELIDGDSLYFERARRDVIDALDTLEETSGSKEFVVVGLCTGAFNAFGAARGDERVKGAVLLDGYSYPTVKSHIKHYSRRAREPWWWRRLGRRLLESAGAVENPKDMTVFKNEEMPKESFRTELIDLLERGTRMMLVYTGLGPLAFNYPNQLQEAFPDIQLDGQVTIAFYPEADHTFTLPANRERMLGDIERWLTTTFREPGG